MSPDTLKLPVFSKKHAAKKCTLRGFTLVELIVVILILGVLGAKAMPKYLNLLRAAHGQPASPDFIPFS